MLSWHRWRRSAPPLSALAPRPAMRHGADRGNQDQDETSWRSLLQCTIDLVTEILHRNINGHAIAAAEGFVGRGAHNLRRIGIEVLTDDERARFPSKTMHLRRKTKRQ